MFGFVWPAGGVEGEFERNPTDYLINILALLVKFLINCFLTLTFEMLAGDSDSFWTR